MSASADVREKCNTQEDQSINFKSSVKHPFTGIMITFPLNKRGENMFHLQNYVHSHNTQHLTDIKFTDACFTYKHKPRNNIKITHQARETAHLVNSAGINEVQHLVFDFKIV